MSKNIDRRLDCYEINFGREAEDELKQEVKTMEENSSWINGISSCGMSLDAIDGPICAKEISDRYGLDYDLTLDTAICGTSLFINTGRDYHLVRDTARSSLCETAKLYGSALGRMTPYLFAATINNGLHVARGTTLLLMRYGKASALHSNSEGGYQIMNISELMDITTDMISRRFGTGYFVNGYNSHGYTSAVWHLIDAQQKILDIYQNALGNIKSVYPTNFMPAIRFASSDTAMSCAVLEPIFVNPKNGASYKLVDGVRIRHSKRGSNGDAMEQFRNEADNMFARFEESAEVISKLANTPIYNGVNAVVSLCTRYGIAKKYGDAAREEMEHLTAGGYTVNAHDLYLCMTEVLAEAERCNASKSVMTSLEESVAKVLHADWSEHDVGGVVSW